MVRLTRWFAAAALAAPLSLPVPATAEVTLWREVSGWDISFYPNLEGCSAFTIYEEGTNFFIGFQKIEGVHYLAITLMDDDWASIEAGKEYVIRATFGDESPWTLDMDGEVYGSTPGLTGLFALDETDLLVDEFQRELRMEWSYSGVSLGLFTLRGSRRAFDEVVACQTSYNEAVASSADPFATGTKRPGPRDPFAD